MSVRAIGTISETSRGASLLEGRAGDVAATRGKLQMPSGVFYKVVSESDLRTLQTLFKEGYSWRGSAFDRMLEHKWIHLSSGGDSSTILPFIEMGNAYVLRLNEAKMRQAAALDSMPSDRTDGGICYSYKGELSADQVENWLVPDQIRCESGLDSSLEPLSINAEQVIQRLELQPLPGEGGYYREYWRAKSMQVQSNYGHGIETRDAGTAIYFLITPDNPSVIHLNDVDEVYCWHGGRPVKMLILDEELGTYHFEILGGDIQGGQKPSLLVPKGVWHGSHLLYGEPGDWTLFTATVAPGFEFRDIHFAGREELIEKFAGIPFDVIEEFTKPK